MVNYFKKPDIKQLQSYVAEAKYALRDLKNFAWVDSAAVDGKILSDEELSYMEESGVEPVEINRLFPVVNLLLGSQAVNRFNIVAKGRTQKDSDVSNIVSEGIKFVMDQNLGQFHVSRAFEDQIKAGFGFIGVGLNPDPRQEVISIRHTPWEECFWDPFSDPWLEPEKCKYFFREKWVDLDILQGMFPQKAKDIEEVFSSNQDSGMRVDYETEADLIESDRKISGSNFVDVMRKRVKPVEMYYSVMEQCVFAVLPGERVIELTEDMEFERLAFFAQQAISIKPAVVRKMYVATFLGDVELQNIPTPYNHDLFPFVPFVSYLDRYNQPYGVVRQVLGQAKEVVKRRSMALALMKSKRVSVEEDAVPDKPNKEAALQLLYEESQKLDSFFVLKSGGLSNRKFQVQEMGGLAADQLSILNQSKKEIAEISGANDEMMGYKSNATSGVALERRQAQAATVTATLFDNYSRSLSILGTLIRCGIQQEWAGEKVLRVTDNISGTEKYIELNKKRQLEDGSFKIENDITQGTYDIVISKSPLTNTIREEYLQMVTEWIRRSPPEIIPVLMDVALELSDLPNKEILMQKIRPLLGFREDTSDLSQEELAQIEAQKRQAQQEQEQKQAELAEMMQQIEIEKKKLENSETQMKLQKMQAEIQKILAGTQNETLETKIKAEESGVKAFEKGVELAGKGYSNEYPVYN